MAQRRANGAFFCCFLLCYYGAMAFTECRRAITFPPVEDNLQPGLKQLYLSLYFDYFRIYFCCCCCCCLLIFRSFRVVLSFLFWGFWLSFLRRARDYRRVCFIIFPAEMNYSLIHHFGNSWKWSFVAGIVVASCGAVSGQFHLFCVNFRLIPPFSNQQRCQFPRISDGISISCEFASGRGCNVAKLPKSRNFFILVDF